MTLLLFQIGRLSLQFGSTFPSHHRISTKSLQINSVISFFATIAKLSLSSAVGAAISQSKWLWYRQAKPRRLQDLQMFDDASRGPWGAVQLLISLRAR